MTLQASSEVNYKPYWVAWGILLVITLAMITISNPTVLIIGMSLKATIIGLWFMHLRSERPDFVMWIVIGIFAVGLILFLFIVPDARSM